MMGFGATVTYLLLWGSMASLSFKPFSDINLACSEAQTKAGGAILLRVRNSPSMNTYAINCVGGNCPTPPPIVSAEEVKCVKVPAQTREVTEPERWEVRP